MGTGHLTRLAETGVSDDLSPWHTVNGECDETKVVA